MAPLCAGSLHTAWNARGVGSDRRQMEGANMPVAESFLFIKIGVIASVHHFYVI